MERQSIDIPGFGHVNPIPAASRFGPLLMTSVIGPSTPGTKDEPPEPAAQVVNLFHHVGEVLRAAGADWGHIVKMNFSVPDLAWRAEINGPWLEHFPDEASRPARHTQLATGATRRVTCDFVAYIPD